MTAAVPDGLCGIQRCARFRVVIRKNENARRLERPGVGQIARRIDGRLSIDHHPARSGEGGGAASLFFAKTYRYTCRLIMMKIGYS